MAALFSPSVIICINSTTYGIWFWYKSSEREKSTNTNILKLKLLHKTYYLLLSIQNTLIYICMKKETNVKLI